MRGTPISFLLIPLAVACGSGDDGSGDPANGSGSTPQATGTGGGGTGTGTGTGGTGGTTQPPASSFTEGGYMLDELAIVADHDTDGDGVTDNNLPLVLNLVNVVLGSSDYTVEAVNAQIAASLYPENILLVDAWQTGSLLTVELLLGEEDGTGFTIDPASYAGDGTANVHLEGVFSSETDFLVASDTMELPIVLFEGADPVPLVLVSVELGGTMDTDGLDARLYGAIPVEAVIDDMVEPLIPEEGFDLNGDGVNETKEEIMDLVWSIAPAAGDVDLGGGATGVSTLLEFGASPAAF